MGWFRNPSDREIADLLKRTRTIAVVGLSPHPWRPSNDVSQYMKDAGYRIVPVNPNAAEALGEKSYPRLMDVPGEIDLVNIFRSSAEAGKHVDEAIVRGAKAVWLQLGVVDEAAAERARKAGLTVVMDRCIMVEHGRLLG